MSVPILPKIIKLTLDGDDYAEDVISAAVIPTPGAIQTVRTLDGVAHSDAESESWSLVLTCVQDWDSVRPGLAHYLQANKGDKVPFVLNVYADAAGSTTAPELSGTVTLVPIAYGGDGNVYAESEVTMPLDGAPTVETA